jgi:tRNA A-37 threonylcarbamoyl transferase component Bud32/CheY-like chemotaxis protein
MRFLIVDGSSEFRSTVARMLRARWPAAQTEEWDPQRGSPCASIARGRYSAVLLDAEPAGADGLAWTAEIRKEPEAPAVLLMSRLGGESETVKALRAGASDLLRRNELTPERLTRSLEDALREQDARRAERGGAGFGQQTTVRLDVRGIGAPVREDAQIVPGYRILRQIGQGGQAQVYLAERARDGLQLVLKVLDSSYKRDETFLRRFVREYRLIASIRNEHVAQIYDQGFSGEHPFIAMEYFPGGTLAVKIHEGVSSLAALRITSQIARALDAIHAHGIVHRDLKPQNILFRANGRLAIVDFGLARDLTSDSNITRVGDVLATPRYMSPEQCLGRPADHRSDLYSLGVIFYEMLAGKKLFDSDNPAGLVYMHIHAEVPRLPPRLAGYQPIVDRLLSKKPEARYQSARDLFATIAI